MNTVEQCHLSLRIAWIFSMWQERTADENGEQTVKGKKINTLGLA